ncbi:MAG: hypothetical protein ACRDBO_04895 [Lachnospiraceae bacterium]
MGFGIGINCETPDAGELKRIQQEIACECWYTASGRSIPLMFQIKDDDGMIQTVRNIHVISSERKRYAGVPSIEYDCMIEWNGTRRPVRLIFFINENRWVACFN